MCIAIPMMIKKIEKNKALCELDGISTMIDISLIKEPSIGDYVIIHAGIAVEKLSKQDAEEQLKLFSELVF